MDREATIKILTDYLVKNKNTEAAIWAELIFDICNRTNINTKDRLAMFVSQCSHESSYFRVLSENLNYSAQGLRATFGKYFTTDKIANEYARKPEQIANRVYSNRMGNGDEKSGDGWKYRGRGIIQLTGKTNYNKASLALYENDALLQRPDLIASNYVVAVEVACWFWNDRNLNKPADLQDVTGATKIINGGTNGLDDRLKKFKEVRALLDL